MNNHYMNNNKIIIETPLIKVLNFYFLQFKKNKQKIYYFGIKINKIGIFFCDKKHIFLFCF